jgi:hypothetical protein
LDRQGGGITAVLRDLNWRSGWQQCAFLIGMGGGFLIVVTTSIGPTLGPIISTWQTLITGIIAILGVGWAASPVYKELAETKRQTRMMLFNTYSEHIDDISGELADLEYVRDTMASVKDIFKNFQSSTASSTSIDAFLLRIDEETKRIRSCTIRLARIPAFVIQDGGEFMDENSPAAAFVQVTSLTKQLRRNVERMTAGMPRGFTDVVDKIIIRKEIDKHVDRISKFCDEHRVRRSIDYAIYTRHKSEVINSINS